MKTRKELIYSNIKNITPEEIGKLGDMALNACDVCGEIDDFKRLNWVEGEDFTDNSKAIALMKKGNVAVCDHCLEKE